ncbi:phospholipase/carboxylesterase [Cellvibrio zantedeschiae]|uniref:Phospholipase/carboxylesterase n=1 Tax=Cellvibrio zantedeschiae TaxID=1237077 RepID=A0ABQ3ASU6_9GAMM|nr:dienelactone hydrolase family protein [Cellvibrio zantedeschiae]GGY64265.1 phospholipase/carboxylesterase [Cellvibrio zantedeschiae]
MNYLPCIEVQSNPKIAVSASVIWLHGLGADGNDFAPLARELRLPENLNVRFIFPNAPSIPVTVNNGYVMPAWYDIFELTLDRKIDATQLRANAEKIHALIEREIERGVPSEKIVIAGFSQGGAVAYEAALSYGKPLAGLLALSTYFATTETLIENSANKQIPILIQHGSGDFVVDEVLGQRAYRELSDRGYSVKYETYNMDHTVCAEQVDDIRKWLLERI